MSKVGRIAHIGLAVNNLDDARAFYEQGLGIGFTHEETVEAQGVRVGFLPVGDSGIELLEPLNEESPVGRFLAKRGEGIHHICLEVEDIVAAMAQLADQGAELLDQEPRIGAEDRRVAFVHPRSAHGVLIELSEKP